MILAGRDSAALAMLIAEPARDNLGATDIETLLRTNPRLKLVNKIAQRQRFFHCQLMYADQFTDRGGFDIVIGNPPGSRVNLSKKPSWVISIPGLRSKR